MSTGEPVCRSSEPAESYPGDSATAAQLLLLAEAYRKAAKLLLDQGEHGLPLSRAPLYLTAIHAIELYMNALLKHGGHEPSRIRSMQHRLRDRSDLAVGLRLQLRARTTNHLAAIDAAREYLVARYDPSLAGSISQLNRLTATLDEIAGKVARIIGTSP